MAPVLQLGEVSWSVVCAACCHMTLVFPIMHLYKKKIIASVHSFFILFKILVLINRRNGPRYQRVLPLCAFLTGVIPKGLILQKICVRCFVCFVLCQFVSGRILWILGNLWCEVLCAE